MSKLTYPATFEQKAPESGGTLLALTTRNMGAQHPCLKGEMLSFKTGCASMFAGHAGGRVQAVPMVITYLSVQLNARRGNLFYNVPVIGVPGERLDVESTVPLRQAPSKPDDGASKETQFWSGCLRAVVNVQWLSSLWSAFGFGA